MKKIIQILLFSSLTFQIISCKYLNKKEEPAEIANDVVAKIDGKFLYKSDLEGLISKGTSAKDSTDIVQQFIKNWIKKHLLLQIAESNISIEELDIDKKLEDYRYQLILFEYQKNYINEKLNSEVSEEEILEFYKKNKDNFQLKEDIVRCHYMKIPIRAPKSAKVYEWFRSKNSKNYNKLKAYSENYSNRYSFDDSTWFSFNEIIKDSPLMSIPNKADYLRHNKNIETRDAEYIYLLKILDYKISDQTSPLEFAHDKIENIIINKRKTKLIKDLEQEIYDNAKSKNTFEIL